MLGGRKLSRIGLWLLAATVMVAGLFFSLSRMGIISAVASLASDGGIFWISAKSGIVGRCGDYGLRDYFGFMDGSGSGAGTFWNHQRGIYERGRE